MLFSFIDHLAVMFGEELPPWDADRKYQPQNLQVGTQRSTGGLFFFLINHTTILLEEYQLDAIAVFLFLFFNFDHTHLRPHNHAFFFF